MRLREGAGARNYLFISYMDNTRASHGITSFRFAIEKFVPISIVESWP